MRRIDVNFSTFGGRETASSRLRAWMIADELLSRGHRAVVNGARVAPIEVFQKVRNVSRMEAAAGRGSTIIFDFDDHYLLDHVGTRDDTLGAMNRADLVTVGSFALLKAAERYHQRVRLFENPLDVPATPPRRPSLPWRGRIGWFGNRTNLAALEALDLAVPVTTVTRGGDVEWSLEGIDASLADLDLVVLPSARGEWHAGKNANRLLKCVAIGVPALLSQTPEHERTVGELGLPPWVLVGAQDSWVDAIERAEAEYDTLLTAFAAAGRIARDRHGIAAVTDGWLTLLASLDRPEPPRPLSGAEAFADTDVVVLDEQGGKGLVSTLTSLRMDDVNYSSISVIAPSSAGVPPLPAGARWPIDGDDYFDLYGALARTASARPGGWTLLVRAGVELRRGFFAEGPTLFSGPPLVHLEPHLLPTPQDRQRTAPTHLLELLARPLMPLVLLVRNDTVHAAGGLDPHLLTLAPWELLVRMAGQGSVADLSHTMLATAPASILEEHPIQGYALHVRRIDPALAAELPGVDAEWDRLRHVLHAAVVERHSATFAEQLVALLPAAEPQPPLPTTTARPARQSRALHAWELLNRRGMPAGIRRMVRAGWTVVRPMVPAEARLRYYRRFRPYYEVVFPERRPRRR